MMEDIYSNLDNYNEEATIEELQNENKELKSQLEDLNSRLETLQKDFDKLSSEHKKLESNYSSLLKTAKAEVERKTKAIALLNAEKDKLVLQTLQNRKLFNCQKNAPGKIIQNEKWKNNNQTEKKSTESERRDSRISPKEDLIRSSTENSAKETIVVKRPNIDDKPRPRIRNRRKSMPAFDTPARFSSDEEDIPLKSVKENFIPREYPDRHFDRHNRLSNVISESSSVEERNTHNYEFTKGPKSRHHRNVETDKSRSNDRSERYKRDSPGRNRKRNRGAYEDKRTDYDRHRRFESPPNDRHRRFESPPNDRHRRFESPPNDRHRRLESPPNDRHRRLESPPNDKYSNYSLRQHPNYEKLRYQDSDRYNSRSHDRHATKHKAPEYDEPQSKKIKPNTYQRQYEDEKWNHEKHQIPDDYDKHFTSCQSPDINFMESSPNHHKTIEIKLNATTKLDDPRKSSDRYVKDTRSEDTLIAVRSLNVDIPRLPLENTSYQIEYVKMPEALKEKPTSDDILNQIYNDVDNPLSDVSFESGELSFDSLDNIHLQSQLTKDENGQTSKKNNKTDKNLQQNITTYKIPKIKPCTSNTQSCKNKDVNVDLPVKHNDGKFSVNTEVKSNASKSKRKTSLSKDEIDKPLLNASIESGEIPLDAQEKINSELLFPNNEKRHTSNKNSTKTDKNLQQNIATHKIPKTKSCSSSNHSNNKDANVDLLITHKDNKFSDNIETKSNNSKSKKKPSLNKDVKKDKKTDLQKTPVVVDKPCQLPILNTEIESKDEHEMKKHFQKIIEDDLELSDETCDYTEIHKTKDTVPIDNKTVSVSETPSLNVVLSSQAPCEVDASKDKSGHDKKIKSKRRHSKHKSTQEQTTSVKQIEKPVNKVEEKHEVKSNEVIKHKFSELFGDSNSLILPEDLGLPTVPPAQLSQPAELPIFEDAQDATNLKIASDLNVIKELPKLNEIETNKLTVEKDIDAKTSKLNTHTKIVNKDIKSHDEILPVQSVYKNLEVAVKPKEDAVKTVIISTGIQPYVEKIDNMPLVEEHSKPININLKALATSTPHKLAMHIPDINPEVTKTNEHTDHSKEVNSMDTSNVDTNSNEADVPDVRIIVKRRRRVVKKS